LGEKDFSPTIMKELLGYTASLGLTTSYQCKINRSILIDPLLFDNRGELMMEFTAGVKSDLKDYYGVMQLASPDQREKAFPTFVIVWLCIEHWASKLAIQFLQPEDPDRLDVCRYSDEILKLNLEQKAEFVLSQVRYARLRGTFAKRLSIIEVGTTCLAPESVKVWSVFKRLIVANARAECAAGSLPKQVSKGGSKQS
jgi:hypothetical protein